MARSGDKRDTLTIRLGKKMRPALNRWVSKRSLVPLTPTIDPALLPWTMSLGEQWRDIQAECRALLDEREKIIPLGQLSPYHRKVAPDDRWKSYFFIAHGFQVPAHLEACPSTAAFLRTIPDLVTAWFSVMDAGTHVPRHKGISKSLLNVHLGLSVPAGPKHCRIRIGKEVHGWSDGDWLVIDDTYPHEVWNDTDQPRAILFIQVLRPTTRAAKLFGRIVVEAMNFTPYIRDARRRLQATRIREDFYTGPASSH